VLPQVFAFRAAAPKGEIGINGFVFDQDNLIEEHLVIINWGDGTTTTLFLPPAANEQVQLYGGGFVSNFVHRRCW
jgi:hypothetical protein